MTMVLCGWICLAAGLSCDAAPANVREAGIWLEGKAIQLTRSSRVLMDNGTAAFSPQVGLGYDAFWLRDYAYMLEGAPEAFTDQELRDSCQTFVSALRSDGAGVDCVRFNGTPIYMPGYGSMGENPVTDGGPFTVDVAWRTHQRLQDRALLQQIVDPLIRTMNAVPRDPSIDPRYGPVYIDPAQAWDRCPYGFTDTIKKTGDVLFTSLLDVRASRQLSDLLSAAGRTTEAADWQARADAKAANIRNTFWDEETGLFRAATVQNNQPDIWGSAFAVQLGVATESQSLAVAQYLKDHYNEVVLDGQIRHLPDGTYWQTTDCVQNEYQNGAYWGVASGWVVEALQLVDAQLAQQTVIDLVDGYQRHGVAEWDNGVKTKMDKYVASAALPLATLKSLYDLPVPLTPEVIGGTLDLSKNVAAALNGGVAFALNVVPDNTLHQIAHLNDGFYGNNHSWIAESIVSYAGVALGQPETIASLALGRDNGGESQVYNDRYAGTYTFQYTRDANPGIDTPEADWTSIGFIYLDSLTTDDTGYLRRLYRFDPIAGVTGIRILLDGSISGMGIDELEVYAVPEPAGVVLLLMATVFVLVRKLRPHGL